MKFLSLSLYCFIGLALRLRRLFGLCCSPAQLKQILLKLIIELDIHISDGTLQLLFMRSYIYNEVLMFYILGYFVKVTLHLYLQSECFYLKKKDKKKRVPRSTHKYGCVPEKPHLILFVEQRPCKLWHPKRLSAIDNNRPFKLIEMLPSRDCSHGSTTTNMFQKRKKKNSDNVIHKAKPTWTAQLKGHGWNESTLF